MPNEFTASMWKDITSVAAGMDGVVDTNNDDKIDERDFTESDANNMMILRKAMLDPGNPAAKEIFADWYTGQVRKTHESGAAMRQEKLNTAQGGNQTQSNKPFTYPSTQSFKGGITGGQLNSLLNGLRAGKLDQADGTSINLNKQTGMWESSDTTDEYTGAEVVGFMQTSLGDDAYNIRLDENFKPFMTSGTASGTHNPGNPSHLQNLPKGR